MRRLVDSCVAVALLGKSISDTSSTDGDGDADADTDDDVEAVLRSSDVSLGVLGLDSGGDWSSTPR